MGSLKDAMEMLHKNYSQLVITQAQEPQYSNASVRQTPYPKPMTPFVQYTDFVMLQWEFDHHTGEPNNFRIGDNFTDPEVFRALQTTPITNQFLEQYDILATKGTQGEPISSGQQLIPHGLPVTYVLHVLRILGYQLVAGPTKDHEAQVYFCYLSKNNTS